MIDSIATLIVSLFELALLCLVLVMILETATFPFRLVAGQGWFLTRLAALALAVVGGGWWFASAVQP